MPSLSSIVLISATSLALAACSGTQTDSQDISDITPATTEPELISIGAIAPDFTLETIEGKTVSLEDLRGRVVVLDFWTTWCLGCVQEVPLMNEFSDWAEHENLPITVIAINTHPNKNKELHLKQVRTYLANNGIDMMVALDPEGTPVAREYGVRAFPSNVIINPEGFVTATGVGMKSSYVEWLKDKSSDAMQ